MPFVAELALREKQIQQNVRPVIAVHKWFARRPGSLFRALLLAEFADGPLSEAYSSPHQLDGVRIADPFMGGGTPLLEANRLGCEVLGWDVNPMAYWVVRQEIEHLDLKAYLEAARSIESDLAEEVGHLYRTRCLSCGDHEASVKYFVWVKTHDCPSCRRRVDLFPGYLLAADQRHPRNVVICAACGELTEVEERSHPGGCASCGQHLLLDGPARRSKVTCPNCDEVSSYPAPGTGPPAHRMVAIEYHCWSCKAGHKGRFFKMPDHDDLERYREAEQKLRKARLKLIPDDPVPPGDETARLHRWGYESYRQMFNSRQLLGLGRLAQRIVGVADVRLRNALATNLSDLLRYQNMLCRYDTRALKSLDIFSVHGFPVGLVQCESNLLGIQNPKTGTNVGSGGWSNIVEKFARAKRYCDQPFETLYRDGRKYVVAMDGEWIGESLNGTRRHVELKCASATEADVAPGSLDAVLTDPPYFANVQYAELMDFCYAWLRRIADGAGEAFDQPTTHRDGDLTGNETLDRGLEYFVEGLSLVYRRMATALKPGAPLVFTYHHNDLEAYYPVAVALLDAGLVATASIPCPAEMGGSIHIHKSGSSIVDTVFVCRTKGVVPRRLLANSPASVAELVAVDVTALRQGGVPVTKGDARCIAYGHLIRLAVWRLRTAWDSSRDWSEKLAAVKEAVTRIGGWGEIESLLAELTTLTTRNGSTVHEGPAAEWDEGAEVAF